MAQLVLCMELLVSAYTNSPIYFAKFLAPIVHGYQEKGNQGLYIWPRVVCLFIHIQCEIMSRTMSRMGRQPVLLKMAVSGRVDLHRLFNDWRCDWITGLFGTVNKAAARRFQARLEATVKAKSSALVHSDYRIRRDGLVTLWRITESHVRLCQKTTDSAAFKFFMKVREQMVSPV